MHVCTILESESESAKYWQGTGETIEKEEEKRNSDSSIYKMRTKGGLFSFINKKM